MHPMLNCSVEGSGTSRWIKPPSEAVRVEQVRSIRTDLLKPCLRVLSLRRFAWAEETRGPDPRESAQSVWRCSLTHFVSWILKHHLQRLTDFRASAAEALPLEHLYGGISLTRCWFMLSSAQLLRMTGFTFARLMSHVTLHTHKVIVISFGSSLQPP